MKNRNNKKNTFKSLNCVLPKGLNNIDELANGAGLNPDRLKVFLHQIYERWIYNELSDQYRENQFHQDGWVTLSSRKLTILFTDQYRKYEKFLEEQNIIEIKYNNKGNKSYVSGERCTPYRINPKFFIKISGRRFKQVKITDYKTLKSIDSYWRNFESKIESEEINSVLPFCKIHKLMFAHLSHFYFDSNGLEEFLNKIIIGNIGTKNSSKGILDAEFLIPKINEGKIPKPIVCKFGERFHSIFTRLPKEFRNFLRLRNNTERLCSVDISNCQAYILAIIFVFPNQAKMVLPEFSYVLDKIKAIPKKKQRHFLELCTKGEIYEFWMRVRGLHDRDDAKSELIKRVLFDSLNSPRRHQKIRSDFKFYYPDVWDAIAVMKSITEREFPLVKEICTNDKGDFVPGQNYHKTISCMCQRFESRMMTGMIIPSLINLRLGPFLTIHDSIVIPESNVLEVKSVIEKCFSRLGVSPPTVKIDTYGVNNSKMS